MSEFTREQSPDASDKSAVDSNPMPQWVREEMTRRGLDPKRPFNDIDLGNATVVEGIKADPTLTDDQKRQVLEKGSPHENAPGKGELGFEAVSFADNAFFRPKNLHSSMLDVKNPRDLRVAALSTTGEVLTSPGATIHAQVTSDPSAALGFVTPAGVYLDREQASAYRAGMEPLVVAARSKDGAVVTKPGARVHSEVSAEWDSTLGYVTGDGAFHAVHEAAALTVPPADRPPAYLKALQPFEECLDSLEAVLEYRAERISAYKDLLRDQIGLTADQAERLVSLLARDASTARFERELPPEQRIRLENFFEGPFNRRDGPFDDWVQDSKRDPVPLSGETDKCELARVIVRELTGSTQPTMERSDRFLYPVVALLRLRAVGGTWRDVAGEVVSKLRDMRAGNDSEELYAAYGKEIRKFAVQHGVDLPLDGNQELMRCDRNWPSYQQATRVDVRAIARALRMEWTAAPNESGRADVLAEADNRLKEIGGSGLTAIPLRAAVKDFIRGVASEELLEQRARDHERAVNLRQNLAIERPGRSAGLER